ncbi:MAG: DUF6525 family protein [Pseudomonadota bacterium]
MPSNRGATSLKRARRTRNPMSEFDRLPQHLRRWVSFAILPWRAQSVQQAYDRALARTGSPEEALAALDRLQAGLVARDAGRIWGSAHPTAAQQRQM